jgi:protein-L-isoaspartate(D-aspartate) O-methyltransferase
VVARMTLALGVGDRHSVLEIGTGSGYQSAVLARLARRVTTIERFRTLARQAERHWTALGLRNISGVIADGALGWKLQAPFDRILITASCAAPPARLLAQLGDGGVLVAPVGAEDGPQRLTLFARSGEAFEARDLGSADFLPLVPGVALAL